MNGVLLRATSGLWLVCWALLGSAQNVPPAPAPPPPPPGPVNPDLQAGKPGRPERNNRPQPNRSRRGGKMLEQVMLAQLSEELELSDEQTVLMVRRFMDFRNKRNDLRRERENLMNSLRQAIEGDASDPRLEELLNRIRDLHEALIRQLRELYEDLSRDLNVRQRAKLFLFLEGFDAEVQQMLRRAAEQRLGPPMPPPRGEPHPATGMMPPGPPAGPPGPPAGAPRPGFREGPAPTAPLAPSPPPE